MKLVALLANQHGAQQRAVLRCKPPVRRKVIAKVAIAPWADLVFESCIRGLVARACVEFLDRLLLIAANRLRQCVLDGEIVVQKIRQRRS